MEELYRENILDHYKHPHNWSPPGEEIEGADLEFHDLNPLCGDELTVQLALDGEGRIEDVRFSGHGCAISQAAASMASDEVKGMQRARSCWRLTGRSCSTCSGSTSRRRG